MEKFTLMGLGGANNLVPYDINMFKRNYSLNTGNLLFNYAAEIVAQTTSHNFSWGSDCRVINKNNNTKGLLLPMANHLGKHVDLSVSGPKIKGVEKPIVVLGLGGQFDLNDDAPEKHVPSGTVEWLDRVTNGKESRNISIRGHVTAKVLDRLGFSNNYEILGCPSLLINPSESLGAEIRRKYDSTSFEEMQKTMSVSAGNPFKDKYSLLERSLIDLVDKESADYIIQHPETLIKLSLGFDVSDEEDKVELIRRRWFPNLDKHQMVAWFLSKSTVYTSVAQWFIDLSKKGFVVGTRIHGIQAAIQAGTPAICLYIDTRTKELCESMHIPCAPADQFSNGVKAKDVFDIFESWDFTAFDKNRKKKALLTKSFLIDNNV
ncbi:polysaccharide pyruvyl transferase family protein, partial [Synechocystis sp. LEGE 06083]|uniref:polysaccharide pyruvyl transferase family protein n=1 Tax=Synechocystis sp. LEGE 06083 TaxID=915336 RepID=UPI00187EEE2F